jgi:hypothetical protein
MKTYRAISNVSMELVSEVSEIVFASIITWIPGDGGRNNLQNAGN